jgi:hypothetical protein
MIGRKRSNTLDRYASKRRSGLVTLGFKGKVDHHDRVFLDDPISRIIPMSATTPNSV